MDHNYEHWIETFSGHPIDPLNPEPHRIHHADIAHALSNQCRFSGHTKSFYCPTEDQKILTDDLQWIPAGNLKVGQRLVGFDELPTEYGASGHRRRKFRPSKVTHAQRVKRQIIRLEMSDGSTVTSSVEHPWLVATKQSRNQVWITSEHIAADLALGRKRYMHKFMEPWKLDESREAGWLSGIYDGEGYLSTLRSGALLGVAQKPGLVWNEIIRLHKELGFGSGKYYQTGTSGCKTLQLHGGWREICRLLGTLRPIRLLDKFQSSLQDGKLAKQMDGIGTPLEIVKAYREKDQWVAGLETSTHTYLCEGFAAHNSVAQHSVHVSELLEAAGASIGSQILALYHDASEAYLVDMPTPIKRQMPEYRAAEEKLQAMIEGTLFPEIPEKTRLLAKGLIKYADLQMLAAEARDLMNPTVDLRKWKVLDGVIPREHLVIPMPPEVAKNFFARRHTKLLLDLMVEQRK